jgi:hypothetical protein
LRVEDSQQLQTDQTVDKRPHLGACPLGRPPAEAVGRGKALQGLDHPGEGSSSQAHIVRVGFEAGRAAHQQPERVRVLPRGAPVGQPELDHFGDQVIPRLHLQMGSGHQRGSLVVKGL